MSDRRLHDDLARWELGELTLDQLRERHPAQDVEALAAVHGMVSRLVDAPTPDPAAAWAALVSSLPERDVPGRRRGSRRALAVAVVASVIAVPTVSYAAAPDRVRAVVREVHDLLPGTNNDGPHNDGDDPAPPTSIVPETPTSPTTEGEDGGPDEPGPTDSGNGSSTGDVPDGVDGTGDPDPENQTTDGGSSTDGADEESDAGDTSRSVDEPDEDADAAQGNEGTDGSADDG